MQLTGPDRLPLGISTRQTFGRGQCGVTELRCGRTQFCAEAIEGGYLLLTNLGSNREMLLSSMFHLSSGHTHRKHRNHTAPLTMHWRSPSYEAERRR